MLAAFTGSAAGSFATSFGGSAGAAAVAGAAGAVAASVFAGSDLEGSDLEGSDLEGSILEGSVLAGSVFAVSFFGASVAGVVATSEGLVPTLSGAGAASAFTGSLLLASLAGSCTVAVVSSLMSAAVGGGTLAGSGRGIAASIASSAALLRGWSWASAEVADTVRKVAATVISTRSKPARLFKQSRIVTHPSGEPSPWNGFTGQIRYRLTASANRAGFSKVARLHATILTQTIYRPRFCSQRHPGQLTTN
ncbi:pentapeptide repeat-containing protein [Bradyrhizobium sp. UFLA05-112]